MRIDFGGFAALMAQQELNVAKVSTGFQKVSCKRMAQGVYRDVLFDASLFTGPFQHQLNAFGRIGGAVLTLKEVICGLVLLIIVPEQHQHFGQQKRISVFFTLRLLNSDLHPLRVCVLDF